nr:lytic transglycosylase domain-containing protein [uncultured Duganella sp.]
MTARRWRAWAALLLALAAVPALAGNQKEEALADAVRLALSNAIKDATPPTPSFRNPSDQARYQNWLETMSYRLQRKLPDQQTRSEFLATVWYEARRAGLDPGLVLGLIQVESAYRKYAVSIAGARGYMQVMPFWTNVIGDRNRRALFDMQTNLRYGCSILRLYLDLEAGNLYLALGRYNGSRGKPDYPNAVLKAWNNWK